MWIWQVCCMQYLVCMLSVFFSFFQTCYPSESPDYRLSVKTLGLTKSFSQCRSGFTDDQLLNEQKFSYPYILCGAIKKIYSLIKNTKNLFTYRIKFWLLISLLLTVFRTNILMCYNNVFRTIISMCYINVFRTITVQWCLYWCSSGKTHLMENSSLEKSSIVKFLTRNVPFLGKFPLRIKNVSPTALPCAPQISSYILMSFIFEYPKLNPALLVPLHS